MVCFTKLTPRTPPSVIHGWKATDLLFQMVKRKNYWRNPISRQNFANALAENHNLKLEVCLMSFGSPGHLKSNRFIKMATFMSIFDNTCKGLFWHWPLVQSVNTHQRRRSTMQLGWNLIGFMENLRIVLTQDNGLPERLWPGQSHLI